MTRYIDADALMEYCSNQKSKTISNNDIARFPTADVVEVIRCGECEYMYTDGRCDGFADFSVKPSALDFCSRGIRRE